MEQADRAAEASHEDGARFDSALARVMFVEPDLPGAARATLSQRRLVMRVVQLIERAQDDELHAMIQILDNRVLPAISTDGMLDIACVIERRAEWMMQSMPRLAEHAQKLRRAHEMATAFGSENLNRLAHALRQEAAR